MQIITDRLRSATTLLAAVLLAGCAAGSRQPTLIYPPAAESGTASAAQTAAVAAPKNKQVILNPFVDRRADKTNIGMVKGGMGARESAIVPANDVTEWVMHAVKTELQNSGYVVTVGTTGSDTLPGASAAVSGEILNVQSEAGRIGKVSLLGKVRSGSKDLLIRNYAGEGSARATFGETQSVAQSLALALASAVKQYVADLNKILESR